MRLLCLIVLLGTISATARADIINLAPEAFGEDVFNPAAITKTANRLIALGEKDGYASLLQLADKSPGAGDKFGRDYYAVWLCQLVYDPKPGMGLPIPWFGQPQFPEIENHRVDKLNAYLPGWPRFPLVISQGVPFLVVFGYSLGGLPEPSSMYVRRCPAFGIYRTVPYQISTHDQAEIALKSLMNSQEWNALHWEKYPAPMYRDMETPFLQKQVDRVK